MRHSSPLRIVESSALHHFVRVASASMGELLRSTMPLRWVDENSLDRVLAGIFADVIEPGYRMGSYKENPSPMSGTLKALGARWETDYRTLRPALLKAGVGRNTTRVLASDRAWISRGQLWTRLAGGLLVHVPQEWPGCFSATASHRRWPPYPDLRKVTLSLSSGCLLIPRHSLVGMLGGHCRFSGFPLLSCEAVQTGRMGGPS